MAKKTGLLRGIEIGKKALGEAWKDVHKKWIRLSSRMFLAYAAMFLMLLPVLALSVSLGESPSSKDPLLAVAVLAGMAVALFIGYTLLISAILGTVQNIYYKKDLPFFPMENLKESAILAFAALLATVPSVIFLVLLASFSIEIFIVVLITASVVVAVRLFYLIPEIAIKKKGLFGALGSSLSLTSGKFWETFGMGFMIALVAGLMGTLLNIGYLFVSIAASAIIANIAQSLGEMGALASVPLTLAVSLGGVYVSATILAIYFTFHTHVYMEAVKK